MPRSLTLNTHEQLKNTAAPGCLPSNRGVPDTAPTRMDNVVYSRLPPPTSPRTNIPRKPVATKSQPSLSKPGSVVEKSQQDTYKTSNWGIGWRTPLTMLSFYITALFIALAHLALFLYLNKKPADGKTEAAPQSYISTASNVLSNTFAMSLQASLATAFTQYLWYILRTSTLKVETIEKLFIVRSSPIILLDLPAMASGPILALIAVMIWTLQIAASFPPGALTVASSNDEWNQILDVSTFNASFVGVFQPSEEYS
jgi:hypothetical protein